MRQTASVHVCTKASSIMEPARGVELVSTLLQNYPGGSICNAFYVFDMFFLRGSYIKMSFFTGKDKVTAQASISLISVLFLKFLAYVQPLFFE